MQIKKVKEIDKLSPEQEALMPEIIEKWVKIATTGQTNDAGILEAIDEIYETAGMPLPRMKIIVDSPLEALVARFYVEFFLTFLEEPDKIDGPILKEVLDRKIPKRKKTAAAEMAQVQDRVWTQVLNQTKVGFWRKIEMAVNKGAEMDPDQRRNFLDRMEVSCHNWVLDQARERNLWLNETFDIFYSYWVAFYDFFDHILEMENKLRGVIKLFESRGAQAWCYNEAAIVNRMPKVCRDSQKRLHNDAGMAIEYPDGYGLWFYKGVSVNEKIIMHPEEITKKDVLDERNEEIRRVMVERIGEERFGEIMDLKEVAKDRYGRLVKTDIAGDTYTCVHVQCPSTGREYYIQVPNDLEDALNMLRVGNDDPDWTEQNERSIWPRSGKMESAHQAVAWTFKKSQGDYSPQVET